MASRFQVTPVSDQQAATVEAWAISTGRSVSSLCASLLDQAVTASIAKGEIPSHVIEMVQELFEPERKLALLEVQLAQLKARNSGFLSFEARIAVAQDAIEEQMAATTKVAKKAKIRAITE